MWTARKLKKLISLFRLGHNVASISQAVHLPQEEVYNILRVLHPEHIRKEKLTLNDPDTEIQNLINYIPQAPPYFRDIAVQRLKQLC